MLVQPIDAVNNQASELDLLAQLRPWATRLQPLLSGVEQLPDSTAKYLMFDERERVFAVLILSPAVAPDMIARNLEIKGEVSAVIGTPLSRPILMPLRSGWLSGLSYAAYPICRELYRSRTAWIVQRPWVRRAVLGWLREATMASLRRPGEQELLEAFVAPLEYVAGSEQMPSTLRSAARTALGRLEDGAWTPRTCLMHGDLWRGNVLLAPGGRSWGQFVLIDWGSAMVQGYGIQDLIRLADSMRMGVPALRHEIRVHCRILGCEPEDARAYLVASFAHYALKFYGRNQGYFPIENFIRTSLTCLGLFDSCGGLRHGQC